MVQQVAFPPPHELTLGFEPVALSMRLLSMHLRHGGFGAIQQTIS